MQLLTLREQCAALVTKRDALVTQAENALSEARAAVQKAEANLTTVLNASHRRHHDDSNLSYTISRGLPATVPTWQRHEEKDVSDATDHNDTAHSAWKRHEEKDVSDSTHHDDTSCCCVIQ